MIHELHMLHWGLVVFSILRTVSKWPRLLCVLQERIWALNFQTTSVTLGVTLLYWYKQVGSEMHDVSLSNRWVRKSDYSHTVDEVPQP